MKIRYNPTYYDDTVNTDAVINESSQTSNFHLFASQFTSKQSDIKRSEEYETFFNRYNSSLNRNP